MGNTNSYEPIQGKFYQSLQIVSTINFEGGLIPESPKFNNAEYEDVVIKTQVDYQQYIANIKRSVVVFNTPAYHQCHGWKLAEFLALGKAIISTPFINEMPEQLTHLENVYFVSGEVGDIRKAIKEIAEDQALRNKLETGALKYYKDFIEPEQAIKTLL